MKKHAYLIMAHNDFYLLCKLLQLLDDKRNDIYLHIDTKAKDVPIDNIKQCIKKGNLNIYREMHVRWGSYRQIQCELFLMKQAKKQDTYTYYHLLSGVDLPLKTQDEIHMFFSENEGKEFLHFTDQTIIKSRNCYERMRFYSFFQGYNKSKHASIRIAYEIFNAISIHIQMLLRMDRIKNMQEKLAFGAQWFSLSDAAIDYILSREEWIEKRFSYTRCCDEMFIQIIIYNSPLFQNVYHKKLEDNFSAAPAMRYIDWDRGNPYVFQNEDYDTLMQSNLLFARKFSSIKDKKIIDRIYESLLRGEIK